MMMSAVDAGLSFRHRGGRGSKLSLSASSPTFPLTTSSKSFAMTLGGFLDSASPRARGVKVGHGVAVCSAGLSCSVSCWAGLGLAPTCREPERVLFS